MGLDIGYHLYDKKKVDEENKFVEADIETKWACGRCNVTYSWGEMFKFGVGKEIVPVFQEGLKGKIQEYSEDYEVEFNFVKFEDFRDIVKKAIDETFEEGRENKLALLRNNLKDKEKIKDLRKLQMECTEDQEFAFDKWSEEINELQSGIDDRQDIYDKYEEEDYSYCHAIYVKELLEEMTKYLKEDKYYVVPYFSD